MNKKDILILLTEIEVAYEEMCFKIVQVACFNLPADTIPVVTNHCTNDSGELESKQVTLTLMKKII